MVHTPIKRKMVTQKEKMEQPQSKHPAQGKKAIGIAIATVVILLGLISLMFFTDTFVGQATSQGTVLKIGEAGFSFTGNPDVGESIPIKANIGTGKTVAVGFVLNVTGVACDDLVLDTSLGWNSAVVSRGECTFDSKTNTATLTFTFATLKQSEAKTGTFDVAYLKFKNVSSIVKLEFAQFTIYKLGTTVNLVTPVGIDNMEVVPATKVWCVDPDDTLDKPLSENAIKPDSVVVNKSSFFTKTTVTGLDKLGKKETKTDSCSGNNLVEVYCGTETSLSWGAVPGNSNCPINSACSDGACACDDGYTHDGKGVCVADKGTVSTCVDNDNPAQDTTNDILYKSHKTASEVVDKGGKHYNDSCKDSKILNEYECVRGKPKIQRVDCANIFGDGYSCDAGACVRASCTSSQLEIDGKCVTKKSCASGETLDTKTNTCVSPVSNQEISFIVSEKDSKGVSSSITKADKVSPLTELDITVTIKPSKDLPKNHILIAQVSYGLEGGGSSPRLVVYELRDALAKGKSETLKFTHKLPEKATGDVKIEAFVWANWPGSAKAGISNVLVKKQERKHGIK